MNYWEQRSLQNSRDIFADAESYVKTLRKEYDLAIEDINTKIYNQLSKMAEEGEMTLQQAKKWLNDSERIAHINSLEEFTKKAQGTITKEIERELNLASRRVRISRLQAMEQNLRASVAGLMSREEKGLFAQLSKTYEHTYYKELYNLQRITGYESVLKINKDLLDKTIRTPWLENGGNFSERIWGRGDKLVNTLRTNLTRDIMTGRSPKESIKHISETMNVSKANASRLVMTEVSAIHSRAEKDSYKEFGVEKYEILATLDLRTSDVCRNMDGKVLDVKDYKEGVTAPPFHVNCRSTTIPYFDDDIQRRLEDTRMARNPETGKSERVENLNYKQWYDKYVAKTGGKGYNNIGIAISQRVKNVKSEKEESPRKNTKGNHGVKWEIIQSEEYRNSFDEITDNPKVNDSLYVRAKWALNNRDGLDTEELYAINAKTGEEIARIRNQNIRQGIQRTKKFNDTIKSVEEVILIHNHPSGMPPSIDDLNALFAHNTMAGITVGHDGSIYLYTKPNKIIPESDFKVSLRKYKMYNSVVNIEKALEELSEKFGHKIKIIRTGE